MRIQNIIYFLYVLSGTLNTVGRIFWEFARVPLPRNSEATIYPISILSKKNYHGKYGGIFHPGRSDSITLHYLK